jgi:hypothetical protein
MNEIGSLSELRQIMSPPDPARVPTLRWRVVEAELGLTLPPDYKAFIDAYGAGCVGEFLWVFHPTTANRYLNLREQLAGQLWALRVLRDEAGEAVPYALYPEPGGLVPWGATDNGDVCYWRTESADPAGWTVAVNESRGPEWDEFPGSMTEFLVAILSLEHMVSVFPPGFPPRRVTFRPVPE